jgi:hypothetical protein
MMTKDNALSIACQRKITHFLISAGVGASVVKFVGKICLVWRESAGCGKEKAGQ